MLMNTGSLELINDGKTDERKLESCMKLLLAIRNGFHKCVKITRDEPLLNLLISFGDSLTIYGDNIMSSATKAMKTNGVINIECMDNVSFSSMQQLTRRDLWFPDLYSKNIIIIDESDSDSEDVSLSNDHPPCPSPMTNNNTHTLSSPLISYSSTHVHIIQQLLTFYVLVYNTFVFCKESAVTLASTAHKALNSKELKTQIGFLPNIYRKFENMQFLISETISQIIVNQIISNMHSTYISLNLITNITFDTKLKMYAKLEKVRYIVENEWNNYILPLLFIMNINDYKLMIKRCIYLLSEYIYISTLQMTNIDIKVNELLFSNYMYIRDIIVEQLSNESKQLSVEISNANVICFTFVDIMFEFLKISNEKILVLTDDEKQIIIEAEEAEAAVVLDEEHDDKKIELDIFSSMQSTFSSVVQKNIKNCENFEVYYKYTAFELKCVEFYNDLRVKLDWQTLLLVL